MLDKPWPAMLRGIWGDPQRYRETYWSRYAEQGWYFAGDGARYDEDGDLWVLGRVDDVMNVSGHRISTSEVESALVGHQTVAEAAVVGAGRRDHRPGHRRVRDPPRERGEHRRHADRRTRHEVAGEISPIAKPRQITVVPELPKTRSGKIMRRLLNDIAEGRDLGDTSTLVDPKVFDAIARQVGRGPPAVPGRVPPSVLEPHECPGRTRTCGQPLRRRLLYPLSYEGSALTLAEFTTDGWRRRAPLTVRPPKARAASWRRTSVGSGMCERTGGAATMAGWPQP